MIVKPLWIPFGAIPSGEALGQTLIPTEQVALLASHAGRSGRKKLVEQTSRWEGVVRAVTGVLRSPQEKVRMTLTRSFASTSKSKPL